MPRLARRPQANHQAAAQAMRDQPREWVLVNTYRSRTSATAMARSIRWADRHTSGAYEPAGAYEARTETVEDGTAVYGRYVGADDLWADAVRSLTT